MKYNLSLHNKGPVSGEWYPSYKVPTLTSNPRKVAAAWGWGGGVDLIWCPLLQKRLLDMWMGRRPLLNSPTYIHTLSLHSKECLVCLYFSNNRPPNLLVCTQMSRLFLGSIVSCLQKTISKKETKPSNQAERIPFSLFTFSELGPRSICAKDRHNLL